MTQVDAMELLVEVADTYLSQGYDDQEVSEACDIVNDMTNKMREKERRRKERRRLKTIRKNLKNAGELDEIVRSFYSPRS